jgi:hypothetical protein
VSGSLCTNHGLQITTSCGKDGEDFGKSKIHKASPMKHDGLSKTPMIHQGILPVAKQSPSMVESALHSNTIEKGCPDCLVGRCRKNHTLSFLDNNGKESKLQKWSPNSKRLIKRKVDEAEEEVGKTSVHNKTRKLCQDFEEEHLPCVKDEIAIHSTFQGPVSKNNHCMTSSEIFLIQ